MARGGERARLLSVLADALNACERAGLKPKLRHGGVIETRGGYVVRGDTGWVPRTAAWTPFSVLDGEAVPDREITEAT